MVVTRSLRLPCDHGVAPAVRDETPTRRACRRCGRAWALTRVDVLGRFEWRLVRQSAEVRAGAAAKAVA